MSSEERATTGGNNAVEPAAATSSDKFIQMIGVTSVRLMSCPIVRVPNMKANDAEPRIQPYSNSFPANRGLAALTGVSQGSGGSKRSGLDYGYEKQQREGMSPQ